MLQHLFLSYVNIDEIDLEENAINMMGPYDPTEPPVPIGRTIGEGERISGRRRADNLWSHDGIERDHLTGTDGDIQLKHQ